MTDDEMQKLTQGLLSLLIENKLDWLHDQLLREFARGKMTTAYLSAYDNAGPSESDSANPTGKGRRRQATFSKVAEFTTEERLRITVDAIERIVVDTAEFEFKAAYEGSTMDPLGMRLPSTIFFASDISEKRERTDDAAHGRQFYSELLRQALKEIKEGIDG
ncbi:hypothetical protein [Rhizobium phaseoli]|uniref:hypothetical protein n=1 Tax=Rhizobium phaseoli TaxID=396 RepID=UPI000BE909A9|nr:hypothetical protein [Rhizobium phaseoli]PDS28011.1 hypothetical protein CO650_28640 [Rhizobium phaseoli]